MGAWTSPAASQAGSGRQRPVVRARPSIASAAASIAGRTSEILVPEASRVGLPRRHTTNTAARPGKRRLTVARKPHDYCGQHPEQSVVQRRCTKLTVGPPVFFDRIWSWWKRYGKRKSLIASRLLWCASRAGTGRRFFTPGAGLVTTKLNWQLCSSGEIPSGLSSFHGAAPISTGHLAQP